MNFEKCHNCGHNRAVYHATHDQARCAKCNILIPDTERVDIPLHELSPEVQATIKFDEKNALWSWSMGGHPLAHGQYALTKLTRNGDGCEVRFVLPEFLNAMLRRVQQDEKEQTQAAIRHALGV